MFIVILFACQQMQEPGSPLEQVTLGKAQPDEIVEESKPINPEFQDPQQEIIVMGGEEEKPQSPETVSSTVVQPENQVAKEEETVSGSTEAVASDETIPTPTTVSTQPVMRKPARVKDGWMPTLVTTLTTSPIPRAVLAMPGGEEIVVRAGDLLSEEGVIVMAIGEKSVDLATITAEGGQAKVENITLASHYPE